MNDEGSLISAGLRIVNRHKRYIFWFWLLNLTLAQFGAAAFRNHVHDVLDRSLLADRLLHGFDLTVYFEMVTRPEWGPFMGSVMPAMYFGFLFFLVTLFCLPGVLEGYAAEGKLSREEFFRTCGRNLWRFVRLLLVFAIVAGPIAGLLLGAQGALVKAAGKSTNEKLPFYTQLTTLLVTFLVLTVIRVWFDLAQVDVVLRDQRAVRKSVAAGFRCARRHLLRLLATYVGIALMGLLVLVGGVWGWHVLLPPGNILGALLIIQIMLILLLWVRFWQRASAAALYLHEMAVAPALPPPQPVPLPESTAPAAPPLPPTPEGAAPA